MPPKLTASQRLKLIKRVLERQEEVAQVCREAGISRVLFYRWLARYRKAKTKQRLGILKARKKGAPSQFFVKPQELSPQKRLEMIKRVKEGELVVKVCQDFGISRTIFYRWLKRYEQALEGQKLEALWDRKPQVSKYYQQVPEDVEGAVLSVVIRYPELSTHKIVEFLPRVGSEPILGNHGVQNVLKRYNLNTYEQRVVYSLAHRHAPKAIGQFIYAFQNLFSGLFSLSALHRQLVVRFATSFALGTFAFIVLLGARGYLLILASAPPHKELGFIFATLALFMGMIFFLYSLKYYFTLTIILGLSRHTGSGEDSEELASLKPWWQKIFNFPVSLKLNINNGKGEETDHGVSQSGYLGGLQSDLSQVVLQRKPFVSIHLALYNERRVVNRLLTVCTSMDWENYEVVVVDDSTDETTEILKQWKGHPRVKIIHRESREGYKGGALREALKVSSPKTEFILVFDADFLPYPDTITQFLKYFQVTAGGLDFGKGDRVQGLGSSEKGNKNPNSASIPYSLHPNPSPIAAIQGYQWHVLNKSENWITRGVRSEYAGSYIIERSGGEIIGALKQIAGSVYMIRKDVLDHYGWRTSITEDFELTLRLYQDGWKVVYTPYVQAPSECVATVKRLIRQRMRWAEGHSYNIKKMFTQLMWGRWEEIGKGSRVQGIGSREDNSPSSSLSTPYTLNPNPSLGGQTSSTSQKFWIPSKLTWMEKLEFLYLSPYYLQAALFLIGTFSWFLAEAVFQVKLPFWTALWGWSLILTNLCALPLVNTVGLFLEESEEKDYLGILSFIILSYMLAPFQGYASVKGFLESQEGPWFRTPKTGKITDIFTPGRFTRFISGIFGRPASVPHQTVQGFGEAKPTFAFLDPKPYTLDPNLNPYLSLATANNRFNNFGIRPKRLKWIGKMVLAILLITTVTIYSLSYKVGEVLATNPSGTFAIDSTASANMNTSWQLKDNAWSTVATTTIIQPGMGVTGTFEFNPGSTNSTGETPGTPDGSGWIFDNAFGSDGSIASGNWTFRTCFNITNADSDQVGYFQALVWRVALTGTAPSQTISSYTNFFDTTTSFNGTDIMNTSGNSQQFSFVYNYASAATFTGTENMLYAEFFLVVTGAGDAADKATLVAGNSSCTNDPAILTQAVTIPENVVIFLALVPFVPYFIRVWTGKRRKPLLQETRRVDKV